jgi:hypothetical protein
VFTNSNVSQLIQDNVIPGIASSCVEMPWQKCESVYSGFMHDFGDVIGDFRLGNDYSAINDSSISHKITANRD